MRFAHCNLTQRKKAFGFLIDLGIKHLVLFAFSTENWNRVPQEVAYLMDLFRFVFRNEIQELKKQGVRVRCVGERERFAPDLRKLMAEAERETADNKKVTLWFALSYGGRAEILSAVNHLLGEGKKEISGETAPSRKYLWYLVGALAPIAALFLLKKKKA